MRFKNLKSKYEQDEDGHITFTFTLETEYTKGYFFSDSGYDLILTLVDGYNDGLVKLYNSGMGITYPVFSKKDCHILLQECMKLHSNNMPLFL